MDNQPQIQAFFDEATFTVSYLVADPETRDAAVIDPVMDFDIASGEADTRSADRMLTFAQEQGWRIVLVLETHAHADHLSAAPYIKAKTGAPIGIGEHIRDVQKIFRPVFGLDELRTDGSDFDRLFRDGERFSVGALRFSVMHVPGHTPADIAYLVGDAAFVGDTLFMPDYGTARCDFPGADARTLFRSVGRILSLPPQTRLFMCHDYLPNGRELMFMTTVAEQRASNIHVREGIGEDAFVEMREKRDATLDMPVLILPSVQINMRGGNLPEAEDNGVRYLKVPINAL